MRLKGLSVVLYSVVFVSLLSDPRGELTVGHMIHVFLKASVCPFIFFVKSLCDLLTDNKNVVQLLTE